MAVLSSWGGCAYPVAHRWAAPGGARLRLPATAGYSLSRDCPDYPPAKTVDEFLTAFDAIVRREGIQTFALGGESYGGLLAQAYLARRPEAIDQLILSSTGPANYARAGSLQSMLP